MTLAEAAVILGVTAQTLKIQAQRGRLRATKHGRDWWVTPSEVERYKTIRRRDTPNGGA